MGLIHWWPLHGDTKDYGTNVKPGSIVGVANVTTAGKLGNCLSGGDGTQITAGVSVASCNLVDELSGKDYSFACWFKVHGTHVHYNGTIMSSGNWNSKCWAVGVSQANNQIDAFTNGYNKWVSIGYTLTNDKWYHLVSVQKGSVNYVYLDGNLLGSVSQSPISQSDATNLCIGRETYANGYFSFNGDIEDVRVYDHALSDAEIKELSKGMVIHYNFNNELIEATTNLVTGVVAGGRTTANTTNLTITTNGTDGDTYFYLKTSEALVEGETYTIQCEGDNIDEDKEFTFGVGAQASGNPRFKIQQGLNVLTFVATAACAKTQILFDDTSRTGWAKNAVFSKFQIEKKDHYTPYAKVNRPAMIYNETGISQPSYIQNVTLKTDSASGGYSLNCSNTYLSTSSFGDITNGVTASLWVKVPTYPSANAIVFTDGNSKIAFGFYGTQNAIISCAGYSSAYVSNIKSKWLLNEWNHIVIARNSSGTIFCYLNGEKLSTTGSNNWSQNSTNCVIGGRYNSGYSTAFTGYVDDFRLYQTLLSDQEIFDLYKTKAYITDRGDIMADEFIEDKSATQVTKKSIFECNEIIESLDSSITPIEYIQSTGSQYIDTGYYWTTQNATIVADLEVTAFKASTTIFGNEERYSGSSRYFAHILHAPSANGTYSNYIGTGAVGTNTVLTLNTRHIIEYIAHGDNTFSTKITTNGTTSVKNNKVAYSGTILTKANTTSTTANAGNIFIFSNHNGYNGTGAIQNMSGMKLYRFTMYDNDKMVRDFIPVTYNGTVGLFDRIESKFYSSPNGVAFTAGGIVAKDTTAKINKDQTINGREIIEF